MVSDDGTYALTTEECFLLLATAQLGRLGMSYRALPVVLPVSAMLHGRRIIIQTTDGPILAAARQTPVVAFEIDEIDARTHVGWTVVVTGQLRLVTDPVDRNRFESIRSFPSTGSRDRHFLTVTPSLVSGQRTVPLFGDLQLSSRP